jgi:hypothetical protein
MKPIDLAAATITLLLPASGFQSTALGAAWSTAHNHLGQARRHHRRLSEPEGATATYSYPPLSQADRFSAFQGHVLVDPRPRDPGKDWCGGDFC